MKQVICTNQQKLSNFLESHSVIEMFDVYTSQYKKTISDVKKTSNRDKLRISINVKTQRKMAAVEFELTKVLTKKRSHESSFNFSFFTVLYKLLV